MRYNSQKDSVPNVRPRRRTPPAEYTLLLAEKAFMLRVELGDGTRIPGGGDTCYKSNLLMEDDL